MRNSVTTRNALVRRPVAIAAATLASALVLVSCSGTDKDEESADNTHSAASAESSVVSEEQSGDAIVVEDAYIGAKGNDSEMTAAYMKLSNTSDEDITIDEVDGSLDADYELHEVVDGVMREKADGFTIPAGGSITLEPGHDHLMIMDYPKELVAGDTVTLILEDTKDRKHELKNIPVRVQQSTHEHYADNDAADDSGDDRHEGQDH